MEYNTEEYYLCHENFLDYSGDTDAEHYYSIKIIPNNTKLITILKRLNTNKIDIPNIDLTDDEEINKCLNGYNENVKELTKIIWKTVSYRTNNFDNIDSKCGGSFFKLLSTKYVFTTYYSWDDMESIFDLPNELEKLDNNIVQDFRTILT